jgi:outer membrane protein assembly factor BamD
MCGGKLACELLAIGFLLTSCSDSKLIRDIDENVTVSSKETPESLYEKAATHMYMTNFKSAANGFALVQEQFPYSKWALQAQVMEGFCRYQAHQFDDAIDLFTIFSKLHPRHEDAPYARYMIGLCNYERISIVERDQKDAHEALKAFRTLRRLFPACDYAKDAKFKIDFVLNHLAAQEMSIGRFYQRQGALISAVGRFRNVIVNYPNTEQRPEALLRLAECYATLNMKDEFLSTYEVLRLNHAESGWFKCAAQIYQRFCEGSPAPCSKKKKGAVSLEKLVSHESSEDVLKKSDFKAQMREEKRKGMYKALEREEKYASPRYFDARKAPSKDKESSK